MLSDEELARIIAEFIGRGVLLVALTGGEPLLERYLVRVPGMAKLSALLGRDVADISAQRDQQAGPRAVRVAGVVHRRLRPGRVVSAGNIVGRVSSSRR